MVTGKGSPHDCQSSLLQTCADLQESCLDKYLSRSEGTCECLTAGGTNTDGHLRSHLFCTCRLRPKEPF
jgi:hypothetical protein